MLTKSDASKAKTKQWRVQRKVDADDRRKATAKEPGAMQAGAREYPVPPFPRQHHPKPGEEWAIESAPLFDAPFWQGSKNRRQGGADHRRRFRYRPRRGGADVAIAYLSEDRDAETTKRAVEAEGRRCLALRGDVGARAFCRRAVARTVKELGGLDVLVNNAAFQVHSADFADLTEEHFDTTLKTNLYGYFHMAQEAVPHMKPGSAIINTGSVTGIEGSKALVDYSMTKGGIHAFTRALSGNLIGKGIRVNAVAPGPVWTPLNPSEKQAEDVSQFGAKTPMKRPAQPEEIAPAYVFLASPQCSSYITGEILPIVGGY
ncbi:short-chain dehydrogenase [Mesorhizobium sp. 131-2-1]|nr:short-chain dehydrogenase [Mesorhizobium sp. 131-2-1]